MLSRLCAESDSSVPAASWVLRSFRGRFQQSPFCLGTSSSCKGLLLGCGENLQSPGRAWPCWVLALLAWSTQGCCSLPWHRTEDAPSRRFPPDNALHSPPRSSSRGKTHSHQQGGIFFSSRPQESLGWADTAGLLLLLSGASGLCPAPWLLEPLCETPLRAGTETTSLPVPNSHIRPSVCISK